MQAASSLHAQCCSVLKCSRGLLCVTIASELEEKDNSSAGPRRLREGETRKRSPLSRVSEN